MWDCMLKRLQRDLGGMDHLRGQCSGMIDFSVSSDMEHYVVRIEGVPGIKGTAVRNKMVTDSFIFRIDLPAEYPDHKPIVTFEEPLFHPNCWQSGMLCLDWTPSMSLRDMIIDVVKCINYQIVNLRSIANSEAGEWYQKNEHRLRKVIKEVGFPPDPGEGLVIYDGSTDELIIEEVVNAE